MTRDEKIESNLGLVHSCAKKFINRGIEYDDLYSAGCIGLIKAIDNFDEGLGYKLSTYAVPVILGEIKRLFRDGGTLKISRSLKDLSQKALKFSEEYKKENGVDIPISILSKKLGTDEFSASEALTASQCVLSLTGANDDSEHQIDVPVDSIEETLCEKLSLSQVITELSDFERQLIDLRYFKHKTQTQTASVLNMTQVQVSRKEKKLLLKMRQKLSV